MTLPNYVCEAHTEQWHKERSRVVTGSGLAVIMGMNKYKSPELLKKEYTLPRSTTNLQWSRPAWWGREMELPNLAALNKMLAPTAHVRPTHAFHARGPIGATLDGVGSPYEACVAEDCLAYKRPNTFSSAGSRLKGETAHLQMLLEGGVDCFVVELKNSDLKKSEWPRSPPEHYWCQVQAQLWATDLQVGLLAAKVGAADMRLYVIERDDTFLAEANYKASEFLEEVGKL